ncbi:glycosyltransferase family 4 protein [Sphingobacterium sp. SGR-19]|uniref:glycosyltransferase family 4 protein n=1 Tax=Sphingobacterium sp. SGR-19 TaxID=2710886 RepID=UPI0013EA658F|nr:glycosyltransferase family 4 protein [Sphingobacterium sp. SGR-19]NGM63924.1 glycosyltransferase family 4 protein [Sphingobacterium sp. SGR-19]
MEILFVSHKYPPATGGMEKQSFELIEGMRAYGTVRKIVYTEGESHFQFFRKLNGRILAMIHRYPKIGIVHFNDGLIAAVSLWHVGYSHLRRVVTLHGLDVVFPLKIYERFIFPRFNRYDHIVAVSKATAAAAVQRGISSEKISVIANGISHQVAPKTSITEWEKFQHTYHLPVGKKVLVTLGRPVKRKGFSWFIREVLPLLPDDFYLVMAGPFVRETRPIEKWLSRLPSRWSDLYMLFMGYPSDQAVIRDLLRDPTYSSRVKHVGKLPSADLGILLSHAEAFLMPNINVDGDMEGFGLVCLEASACGTIVLAAALEGITDAIQHLRNGIQVEPKNANAWSKAIQKLSYDDTEDRRSTFRAYTLTHFSWEKMVSEYADLFRELIIK